MKYEIAKKENIEQIYQLVQNTINAIYPLYYPQGVVEFFCGLHSKENIATDIENPQTSGTLFTVISAMQC